MSSREVEISGPRSVDSIRRDCIVFTASHFAIMFLLSCVTDGSAMICKTTSVTGRQEHPLILSHLSLLSFSWPLVHERIFEGAGTPKTGKRSVILAPSVRLFSSRIGGTQP